MASGDDQMTTHRNSMYPFDIITTPNAPTRITRAEMETLQDTDEAVTTGYYSREARNAYMEHVLNVSTPRIRATARNQIQSTSDGSESENSSGIQLNDTNPPTYEVAMACDQENKVERQLKELTKKLEEFKVDILEKVDRKLEAAVENITEKIETGHQTVLCILNENNIQAQEALRQANEIREESDYSELINEVAKQISRMKKILPGFKVIAGGFEDEISKIQLIEEKIRELLQKQEERDAALRGEIGSTNTLITDKINEVVGTIKKSFNQIANKFSEISSSKDVVEYTLRDVEEGLEDLKISIMKSPKGRQLSQELKL